MTRACFLDRYRQVSEARVRVEETVWGRLRIDGREHEHGFVRAEGGTPFACETVTRSSREVEAGFQDFATMKTACGVATTVAALAVMASPHLTIAPYFGNELVRRRRSC